MSSQSGHRGRPPITDDGSILDAVTDAFWASGYEATSITDLSAASGASRASLYKLYGDKDALLAAALRRYAGRFTRRVDEMLASTSDPVEAVGATLRASADRLSSPDAPDGCLRCRTTLELRGRSDGVDAALDHANGAFEDDLGRLLDADGAGRPSDPATARFLTAIVNGMVTLAISGTARDGLEEVIEGALDVVRARVEATRNHQLDG